MFPQQPFADEVVKTGQWFDHSVGRHRLLLKDSTAPYIYAVVIFFITLSTKNVSTIVWRLLRLVGDRSKRAVQERDVATATETTSLIAAGSQLNNGTISTSSNMTGAHENGQHVPPSNSARVIVSGGRDSLRNTWRYILDRHNPHKTWTFLCCFVLLGFQFGILALGFWSSPLMQAGKAALWSSDNCGLWEFPSDDATNEEATRNDVILRQKEARAGEYAKYCYEPWSSNQPLPVYCNFFAKRNISFEEDRPYGCPFPNRSICAGSQVVTFDTGKLPATYLGINQETPYRFRRTATCVPLNTNEPYVREEDRNGTRAFNYYYGKWVWSDDDDDEPLFDTEGDPFEWTVPTYDVSAFTTGPGTGDWAPIEGLDPGKDQALTLLFIRPLQIYYLGPSGDAVFPTDGILQYPDGDRWHIKSDPKAGVLACTEKTELCDPTEDTCWPASHRYDPIRDRGYWLMKLALKDATLYDSIALRLGTALVAQEMISQQLSLALPDDHWRTEARRLFATSLALAQIKAWSIGSGEDHVHQKDYGWENQTPLEAKESGGLCGLLKFKSTGYTDIDLLNFILLLVLPWPLTAFLSTRWATVCSWFRWRSRAPKEHAESGLEDTTDDRSHTETNGDDAHITSSDADGASMTSRRRLVHRTTGTHAVHTDPTASVGPRTPDHSTMKIEAEEETLVVEIVGKPVWFIFEMMGLAAAGLLRLCSSVLFWMRS